ncbi:hypothetical protein INF35_11050 [Subdoligranulum sp. DSM 109015]|uniref:Gram-positive cocci surface proteins LPxTG domain-containing protein n=1 Tax=Gemmiger gallinarum TaxID=2779354 RepID=A0ABR9R5E5_9FIRM|nr:hypothetical protein [Gemmiger gallinarum]MBE5038323.1 hypothetical protein [Gemmiger gallinarum]
MQKTKKFRRLLAALLAVLMLSIGIPAMAFATGDSNSVRPTFQFVDVADGKIVATEIAGKVYQINKEYTIEDMYEGDVSVPNDYKFAGSEDWTFVIKDAENTTVSVAVEKIENSQPTEKKVYLNFYDEKNSVQVAEIAIEVAADAGNVNYTKVLEHLPDGYEYIGEQGDLAISDKYVYVPVQPVEDSEPTTVIMTIRFMDGDEFVAGGDYFLPEGVQNYSVLEQYLPDGYKLSVSGDFMVAEGTSLDVRVEKIVKDVIMNIRFMDGDTFVSGGDYFLPEGVQNYSVLEQYVPVGYQMSVSGDFMVAEGTSLDVRVEKVNDAIIVNIAFVDPYGNVIAGGDYFVPAGVQNRQVLDRYVPQGYKQAVTGDILFEAGEHYDINLVEDTSIVNIQFIDMEGNVIAGGDYFVPTGIHNRTVLNQYVPEGYYQVVTGDIQFIYGQHYEIVIDRVPETATAKTAVFRKGENDVWNENPDNPDEVHYTFWSFDPDEPCTVPSITTGDKSKALDYWVCDLDETVTLQPGEDFCYNDLDQGKLEGCSGDFAFYPVYKDVTTTSNTVTASSDDSSDEVVKAEAPADNSTKILPQTGNQGVVSPVSFVVVLCAALAGAAVYLFAIRKKLN